MYIYVCDDEINSCYVRSHFKLCKKRKLIKNIIIFSLVICFFIFLICRYFVNVVNPIIFAYGEAEINRLLVSSSNNAIYNTSSVSYDDLITINYDINNDISSIVANSLSINNLANSLAIETQREIDLNAKLGISIPFGTCTGIGFLSGRGSPINLSVSPIGNVTSKFFTSFTSVGINQTSHKIYITIQSEASLILPFGSKNVSKSIDYLLCECLIVGDVPNTYLSVSSLSELYK
ncbi:MAG: sporulation protein YunB [Clostridia bacterium]|nr:sporulation protein YunB [Clostridia bacterium]